MNEPVFIALAPDDGASRAHEYAELAAGVVRHALEEFSPPGHTHSGPPRNHDTVLRIVRAVRAGEFLLEREDAIVELWFSVLGVDLTRLRQRTRALTAWHAHLGRLRDRLTALVPRGSQLSLFRGGTDGYDPAIDGDDDDDEVSTTPARPRRMAQAVWTTHD